MKQASFFTKKDNLHVKCQLCPHECMIKPGARGICNSRENIKGELYSMNYGKVTSISLDPIEKKPLVNFHPGTMILSVGTFGCNLKCAYCQNFEIAHGEESKYWKDVTPNMVVDKAIELKSSNNIGIAFTYNEPGIWYEFVLETASLAKKKSLATVLVTNGYMNEEPFTKLIPYIDAMNIDLKAFTDEFYKEICKGKLEHVKKSIALASKSCHVEVTTLVIPTLNDAIQEISALAEWLSLISPHITLHLTRFFPRYQLMDKPITPYETLAAAKAASEKFLKNVYLGNV